MTVALLADAVTSADQLCRTCALYRGKREDTHRLPAHLGQPCQESPQCGRHPDGSGTDFSPSVLQSLRQALGVIGCAHLCQEGGHLGGRGWQGLHIHGGHLQQQQGEVALCDCECSDSHSPPNWKGWIVAAYLKAEAWHSGFSHSASDAECVLHPTLTERGLHAECAAAQMCMASAAGDPVTPAQHAQAAEGLAVTQQLQQHAYRHSPTPAAPSWRRTTWSHPCRWCWSPLQNAPVQHLLPAAPIGWPAGRWSWPLDRDAEPASGLCDVWELCNAPDTAPA